MSGALISLNAWGWALADAVIAAGTAIILVALVCGVTCVLGGRCSDWRRRRSERRYIRSGIRDLERYLGKALPGPVPPRRPGHGEAGQHRDGGGNR
jgi:hypothetical protein